MGRKTATGYVPLDMNYLRDPAIRRAGPDAELLYVRGLAYCKASHTDGVIYEYDLPVIGVGLRNVQQRVSALVRENLWEAHRDGWYVRSWAKWNLSQSELAENKLKRQEAAARTNHGLGRHADNPDDACPKCREVSR